jgi:bifunctional ADP-heptose synthase (sugar kinase/adenylyltransferase)
MASLCLATGLDAYDMARLANLAAGLVCEKVGVVPVEKEWLIHFKI